MKKSLILLLALVTTGILVLAAAVNVTGTWTMTAETQRGPRTQEITFKQDGEKLTVTMMVAGRGGAEPTEIKGEGTVKGNDIEFKITRTTPNGEFTTTYKGKIVDDKNMTITSEMNMGGQVRTTDWKAVRKA